MEKLIADLGKVGVKLDPAAPAWDMKKLVTTINNECHRFCAEDNPDLKKLHYVEYLYKKLLEQNGGKKEVVNAMFSSIIATCKANYKVTKESKVFLRLIEKDSYGLRSSCIRYMKLRKALLEAAGKKNDHSEPLEGMTGSKATVEAYCQKNEIDLKAVKSELEALKADQNNAKGPDLYLAILKVCTMKAEAEKTAAPPATGSGNKVAPVSSHPAKTEAPPQTQAPAEGSNPLDILEKYKKPNFIGKVLEDREDNIKTIVEILFKLHSNPQFNSKIKNQLDSAYEKPFSKYLEKKLIERADKICGTLVEEYSKKTEDKKVIAQVIKLMHANTNHLQGRLKKLLTEQFTDEAQKKYHGTCIDLYIREYMKKLCMSKFKKVYANDPAFLLDEGFEKVSSIDKGALEIAAEIGSKLANFMDDNTLKSSLLSNHQT